MKRVAFIGLGNMGLGMAANQVKAGRVVHAFDTSSTALERAAQVGCIPAKSVQEAVADAEVVITMLPSGAHVRNVYRAEIIPNARGGSMLVDCSTIDVETARHVAGDAERSGFVAVDAPVSGGVAAAEAGTLAFMVGCEDAAFDRVRPALEPMARAIIHAGGNGAGQAAKICNNLVLGISMIAVCEAFALAERLGLDPERFFKIASQSSGQCWAMTSYSPWPGVGPDTPSDRDFEGGFASSLMLKDLRLAHDAATSTGAAIPLGAVAAQVYTLLERAGAGQKDFSVVIQLLRGWAEWPPAGPAATSIS